ncbi:glycopeptide antibiotics resistance protein [Epilithonimonas hungarica]|uniref:VanZ family protein n=1 Tax=Epilithonimonas hungarica TaxID=454006 RepID=UPI002782CB3A|nr:glycopeptide antibiotics resistance protein [Epilithonimonas hungarica]
MRLFVNRYYPVFINIYTLWMLYVLFFASFRYSDIIFEIKFIPLATITECFRNLVKYNNLDFFKNIFGNIILFIPYGFLGILYPKLNKFIWLFLTFFIVINIIEFSQYYFKRGFADIDDIILNTFGTISGFFIYKNFFFIKDRQPSSQFFC